MAYICPVHKHDKPQKIMKFLLGFLFISITTLSNASEVKPQETRVNMEVFDGRKKKKRINKKRKRKCKQFGRRIYAG